MMGRPSKSLDSIDKPLTKEQWDLVVSRLPAIRKAARIAAASQKRKGHPVDQDQMEADALDEVIKLVVRLTDLNHLLNRLKSDATYLPRMIGQKAKRRRNVVKEIATDHEELDEHSTAEMEQVVEDFLQDYNLDEYHKAVLLDVIWNGHSNINRRGMWRRQIQPELQRWAEANGLRPEGA
jgi:hypothetical protein